MIKFPKNIKQTVKGIRTLQFPHYHRKFTAHALLHPIDIIILLILILLILINLFHSSLIGFDREKSLKRKIISLPFLPLFHEQLGAYYLKYNLAEAGKEYLLANELLKENGDFPENKTAILGTALSPFETWSRLVSYNQTLTKDLNHWQNIGSIFPDYSYSHFRKAFLYDRLGNTEGVKNELKQLGWDYKDIPEVKDLKNKYATR